MLRRTRLGPIAVVLVAVATGAVILGWIRYLDTTFLGLPSTETFSLARQDLRDAWTQFGEVVAPAPALPGFVLGACIAVWVAAWVADWAAFRLGSAVEAVLPASAIVVFVALLGSDRHRTTATVFFIAAALAFILLHRVAEQLTTGTWVGNGRRQGPPAVVAVGLGMVVLAVVFGAFAGPRTPGADAEAMLDWHGGGIGDGTRVTVSPLVDIRKRLVDQSDVEAFTVRGRPAFVLATHRARQVRRDRLVLQRQLRGGRRRPAGRRGGSGDSRSCRTTSSPVSRRSGCRPPTSRST